MILGQIYSTTKLKTKSTSNLKNGKAEGWDGIPKERIQVLGENDRSAITQLCRSMYKEGKWLDDFLKGVMIPTEKKKYTIKCEEYRKISLISHVSKVMLKILMKRLLAKAEPYINEDQFGFRKGKGTREAIAVMKVLGERSMEHN